jgi:outer membrane protein, multidrug efflux system
MTTLKLLRILVPLAFLISCKSNQVVEKKLIKELPSAFAESKDSSSLASLNWRTYFTDSTLTALIEAAIENNPDLFIAMQRIEASKATIAMRRGALLPVINANASFWQRKFGLYTMDGAGNITTDITPGQIVPIHLPDYYLGLQTSWEVDAWGKLRNKRRAAFNRYLASVEGKNLVVTNLIADVANSYYELLALDNELNIIRESISLQENVLQLADVQKEAGVANDLAVKRFQAELLSTKGLQFEVLQKIIENENRINLLLGRFSQPIRRNSNSLNEPLIINLNTGIPSQLLRNRPDIRQAEFELLASKADLNAARSAFYPSITITGGLGLQAFRPGLLFTTPESMAYSLLANLVAPLINRSAIKAEFRTANALQLEALYNYEKSILTAFAEVNNEVNRIQNLENLLEAKTQEVEVLTQSIETSSELFKARRANYIEVFMTQQTALQARLALINTKVRKYNTYVNIYKTLGGGWQ